MLNPLIAALLGFVIGATVPGNVPIAAEEGGWLQDAARPLGPDRIVITFFYRLCFLVGAIVAFARRRQIRRLSLLCILANAALAFLAMLWTDSVVLGAIFCAVISGAEFAVWLSAHQFVAVAEIDDVIYHLGLCIGVGLRAIIHTAGPGSALVGLAVGVIYLSFHRRIGTSDCVRSGLLAYRPVCAKFGDRCHWLDWVVCGCIIAGPLLGGLGMMLVLSAAQRTATGSFWTVALLTHLRMRYFAASRTACIACCVGIIVGFVRLVDGGLITHLAMIGTSSAAGFLARNYVLDRFETQDVYLGNTGAAIVTLFLIPHIGLCC